MSTQHVEYVLVLVVNSDLLQILRHGALIPGIKLWYTNNSPFTSYTTVTPHSDSRSDSSAYVTSHVEYTTYKIIACIECATVLQANKASEGVLSYSRLTN